jgi:biopolymer transport protein ExbD
MPQIQSPRHGRKPRIEIIPFIDIMFFLLATFMMVSLSLIDNQGIELTLPTASQATPQPDLAETIVISITKDGSVFRDREPVTLEALTTEFAAIKKGPSDPKIILQGDYECDYGKVVEVFDAARAQGLTRLILRTQKPAT